MECGMHSTCCVKYWLLTFLGNRVQGSVVGQSWDERGETVQLSLGAVCRHLFPPCILAYQLIQSRM